MPEQFGFDRVVKIAGLLVAAALSYATLQAQVSDLQTDKVETQRFVLDSASADYRLDLLEQILFQDLMRIQANIKSLCRSNRIECQ